MTAETSGLEDAQFESRKEEIEQDVDRTLTRVVEDYKNHWQGVLGESIQNSYDAWCTNKNERQTIPQNQDLYITFDVDIPNRRLTVTDNAGGMPRETFYHKFAGLDTPGEEKEDGDYGGAYGRGFHVISGLGQQAIAETLHDGFSGGLEVRGRFQARRDDLDELDVDGTRVVVSECEIEKLLQLANEEQVIEHIQARFQRLLENDNVTLELIIDGESTIVEPIDLSDYEILYEAKEVEFEHGGEDHVLRDIIIYRKEGEDTPFRGMSMCKGNVGSDGTFMRVKEYRPRHINHLDKMFGFCDASDLCPEYENNAHNDLRSNIVNSTPIKRIFEELEREEFAGGPTRIDEHDEIVEAALEILHDNWGENPFDSGDDEDSGVELEEEEGEMEPEELEEGDDARDGPTTVATDDLGGQTDDNEDDDVLDSDELPTARDDVDAETDKGDDDDDKDDEDDVGEDPVPEISCRTRKRFFEPGDEIELRYTIENPGGSEERDFSVRGELEYPSGTEEELESQIKTVERGERTGGADGWSKELDNEGKYVFRVKLYEKGARKEPIDDTYTYFFVGGKEEEQIGTPTSSFIEDIDFFPSDDYSNRHKLQATEDAMVLVVNPSHPEFLYAKSQDGKTNRQSRIATLVRWGHEAILNRMLTDKIEVDVPVKGEGDEEEKSIGEFFDQEYVNKLGELTANAYAGVDE